MYCGHTENSLTKDLQLPFISQPTKGVVIRALKKPQSLSETHQNDLFNLSRECIPGFCRTREKVF